MDVEHQYNFLQAIGGMRFNSNPNLFIQLNLRRMSDNAFIWRLALGKLQYTARSISIRRIFILINTKSGCCIKVGRIVVRLPTFNSAPTSNKLIT